MQNRLIKYQIILLILFFFSLLLISCDQASTSKSDEEYTNDLSSELSLSSDDSLEMIRRSEFNVNSSQQDKAKDCTHVRTQQKYLDIPIFGKHVIGIYCNDILEETAGTPTYKISKDILETKDEIQELQQQFSSEDALEKVKKYKQHHKDWKIKNDTSKLHIYIHPKTKKASLIYLVEYEAFKEDTISNSSNQNHSKRTDARDKSSYHVILNCLIGLKNQKIIQCWNNKKQLYAEKLGRGPGGNQKTGKYQYGIDYPKFDIQVKNVEGIEMCFLETPRVKTVYYYDTDKEQYINNFREAIFNEENRQAFSYDCNLEDTNPNNDYVNTFGEINGSYSPLNDVHFFLHETLNMYSKWLNYSFPNQIHVFVLYNFEMINAFANPSDPDLPYLIFGIGDGHKSHALTSLDITSHEFAHLFTWYHSNLIYKEQSGGINEAFSDISGEAAEFFLKKTNDFLNGGEIFINKKASRYYDDPTKDGVSIGHFKDYYDGLDVHNSSGIFNKAFYVLANTNGWDPKKAFILFAKANQFFWEPSTNFKQGFEGIIQAASFFNYSSQDIEDIKNAFSEVGIPKKIEIIPNKINMSFLIDDNNISEKTTHFLINNNSETKNDWLKWKNNEFHLSYESKIYNLGDWIEISEIGTILKLKAIQNDQEWEEVYEPLKINLPFSFPFFETEKKDVFIYPTGFLTFKKIELPAVRYKYGFNMVNTESIVGCHNYFYQIQKDGIFKDENGNFLDFEVYTHYDLENQKWIIQYSKLTSIWTENFDKKVSDYEIKEALDCQIHLYKNGTISFHYKTEKPPYDLDYTNLIQSGQKKIVFDTDKLISDKNNINSLSLYFEKRNSNQLNGLTVLKKLGRLFPNIDGISLSQQKVPIKMDISNYEFTNSMIAHHFYWNLGIQSNDKLYPNLNLFGTIELNKPIVYFEKVRQKLKELMLNGQERGEVTSNLNFVSKIPEFPEIKNIRWDTSGHSQIDENGYIQNNENTYSNTIRAILTLKSGKTKEFYYYVFFNESENPSIQYSNTLPRYLEKAILDQKTGYVELQFDLTEFKGDCNYISLLNENSLMNMPINEINQDSLFQFDCPRERFSYSYPPDFFKNKIFKEDILMLHEAVNQEFTPKVQVITNESINFKLHKPDSIEFVSAELEKDELIVKYMAHQPRVEGEYACLQIYKNEELLTPYLCKYRDQELGTLVTEKILVPEGISTGDVVYLSNLILRNMESNKITLK